MWAILLITYVQFNQDVFVQGTHIANDKIYKDEASCAKDAQTRIGPVVLAALPDEPVAQYSWNDTRCVSFSINYGSSLLQDVFEASNK